MAPASDSRASYSLAIASTCARVRAERFADVANRRTRPVGDHFGRHRRVFAAVPLVDVLNDLFAILVREVDVDVRYLVALLGKKALEEQLHADRVDRGDAQGIAHRRVGGRTASLGQDAQALRLVRDVPNDEKVACEVHARDDAELVLELALDVGRKRRAVTLARAFEDERAKVRMGARLVFGNGESRKLTSELFQAETYSARRWPASCAALEDTGRTVCAICAGLFKWNSALGSSSVPALARFVLNFTHVSTSQRRASSR